MKEGNGSSESLQNTDNLQADWHTRAECKGLSRINYNKFYLQSNYDKAKDVCAKCIVREACLDYAIQHNEPDGVWGGLDPQERVAIRQALQKPA